MVEVIVTVISDAVANPLIVVRVNVRGFRMFGPVVETRMVIRRGVRGSVGRGCGTVRWNVSTADLGTPRTGAMKLTFTAARLTAASLVTSSSLMTLAAISLLSGKD